MMATAFWDIELCSLVAVDRRFRLWQLAPLKRRSTSMKLHGAISQKAAIFLFYTSLCVTAL
jgi:hypothetical protein